LGKKISQYTFFSYDVHEALHLSEEEKHSMTGIVGKIREEYSKNIDVYTQDLVVSHLELLLNYANRFYGRQFITRKAHNSDLISRFEKGLNEYFDLDKPQLHGLPTVKQCAKDLGMSPDYLSDMLKQETGKNAQEHIHYLLIDRAKTQLLGTSHTVSEIAFSLGFEYPQYFSKLFKKRTGMTPAEFRNY
jgi:AraC-like DNA-binding protein